MSESPGTLLEVWGSFGRVFIWRFRQRAKLYWLKGNPKNRESYSGEVTIGKRRSER